VKTTDYCSFPNVDIKGCFGVKGEKKQVHPIPEKVNLFLFSK
jgi:hypothetical protein